MRQAVNRTDRLVIKPRGLRKNLVTLFQRLEKNTKARDAFIRNPVGTLAKEVTRRRLPPQRVSEANRLLFALLANDEMVRWLRTYGTNRVSGKLDKKQFALAFARQIQKCDDANILAGVVINAARGYGIPGLWEVAYQCVVNETPTKYDAVCTPVAKDKLPEELGVPPEVLRLTTEHLISHAKDLARKGILTRLDAGFL